MRKKSSAVGSPLPTISYPACGYHMTKLEDEDMDYDDFDFTVSDLEPRHPDSFKNRGSK